MLVAPLRHPVIWSARLLLASLRALGLVSPLLAGQTLDAIKSRGLFSSWPLGRSLCSV
jgi:hypothetical protein